MPPTISAVWRSGKEGVDGREAESPAMTVTGAEPLVPSPSIESISTIIARIHASARSRASLAVDAWAVIFMITVSSGFSTETRVTSSSGVVSSSRSSIAFWATLRHPAMSRYDCTLDRARLSPTVEIPTSSLDFDAT